MSRRWRRATATGLALGVLGLHAMLWEAWTTPAARTDAGLPGPASTRAPWLEVRSLPAAPLPPHRAVAPAQQSQARWAQRASPAPPAAVAQRSAPIEPASDLAASTPSEVSAGPVALAEAAVAVAPTLDSAPPVYATRLPDPGRWRYRMQRGAAIGEAELHFALTPSEAADAPGYHLQLTAHAAGSPPIDWASRGQVDAAGLAPDRFALRRKGRDRQAANFQREAGKITFSGPTHAQPLPAGAQDRLSWWLQLTAIVAAAPESFGAGTQVQIYVAGARGDAQVWTFGVVGWEPAEGGLQLLKLVREPARLYDIRAEVWLDPQRQFLPQRLLQTPQGGGAALELTYEPGAI